MKLKRTNIPQDYYPFGPDCYREPMPTRTWDAESSYRFGFNGMEKDDEMKGAGNSYDFGARMLDPRLGRWFACDPLAFKYPFSSPYSFVTNCPIILIDPNGKDIWIVTGSGDNQILVKYEAGKCAPENTSEFVAQAWEALDAQLSNGEGERIISIANDASVALYIKETNKETHYSSGKNGVSATNSEMPDGGYAKEGTVKWNPYVGTTAAVLDKKGNFLIFADDESTNFSPEDKLDHEASGHAYDDLILNTYFDDVQEESKDPGYSNHSEEKAVKNADNNNGKFRNTDIGIDYKANNPNDDDAKGKRDIKSAEKLKIKIIENQNAKQYLQKK